MANPDSNNFFEVRQVLQSEWLKIRNRNRIHALKLSSLISEDDIIQYVIMCLIEAIKSGKQIEHPIAWAKLVSERRIQKVYRKCKFTEATESETIEYLANKHQDKIDFNDNNERIKENIEQLKPASKKIVEMRFFEDLSWKQIAEVLSRKEGKRISTATARKRGERALNELRQIYIDKLTD
jgi:RNA polymerase sigma factor (sigma-70 family)